MYTLYIIKYANKMITESAVKKSFKLPYDNRFLQLELEESQLAGVLTANHAHGGADKSETDIVKDALANPVSSPRLSELSAGKNKIVLITSDHTRAVPSAITMPLILEEIRKGNSDADITVLVATGLHRGMTDDEKKDKFGIEIYKNEKIINHDADDRENLVYLGDLPSGSKCEINRIAYEADLVIAEGFIEPHFFAGFSGGRKSILPGIASKECVNINHSSVAIASSKARNGVLDGNPIHEDMVRAAELANLSFILNVLLDENKKIIAAYSGNFKKAHKKGCEHLMGMCSVKAVKSDIVITTNGGYPLDQNLYQCPKGLAAAADCVNDDGIIILAAGCKDGLGGENFGSMMLKGTPEELMEMVLSIEPEKTISEQWCVQRFAEQLMKTKIILVTEYLDKELVERMKFIHASNLTEALEKAYKIKGHDSKITVIPDGVAVITRR